MNIATYEKQAFAISNLVQIADNASCEQVEEISAAYFLACEEVNERLQKASKLLRRGLRDEAIQECEREPNLLDAVELLDIPHPEAWHHLHRKFHLVLPPSLLMKKAAELNAAYAEQAPIRELLKKHRLLALGHAPLKHRLSLLRQIVDKDENSEVWEQDLEAYESGRFAEIKTQLGKVDNSRDDITINELYSEIMNSPWHLPVPIELRQEVKKLHDEGIEVAARGRLSGLADSLEQTHAEFDVDKAKQLRHSWNADLSKVRLSPSDALVGRVAPVFDWIDEIDRKADTQQQFCEVQAELEGLLDDPRAEKSDLESAYLRLQQFEYELPPILRQRIQTRVADYDARIARNHKLRLFTLVGLIPIVAVIVLAAIQNARFTSRVNNAVAAINTFQEAKNWKAGDEFLDILRESDHGVFQHARFQSAFGNYASAKQHDEQEETQFQQLLSLAGELCVELEKMIWDAEESDDPSAIIGDFRLRLAEYKQINLGLGRHPVVQAEHEQNAAAFDQRSQNVALREINEVIQMIGPELHRLDSRSNVGDFAPRELENIRAQIESVFEMYPVPKGHLVNTTKEALLATIEQIRARQERNENLKRDMLSVTNSIGNAGQFRNALLSLAERYPEDPRARQWLASAEADSAWSNTVGWCNFANRYLTDIRRISPQDAKVALDAAAKELVTRPGFPGFEHVWDKRIEALRAISLRQPKLVDEVKKFGEWWMNVNFIQYEVEGRVRRHYAVRRDGSRLYAAVHLVNDRDQRAIYGGEKGKPDPAPSPQKILRNVVLAKLRDVDRRLNEDATRWEATHLDIVELLRQARSEEKELDPILKLDLLKHVLSVATTGSRSMANAYSNAMRELDNDAAKMIVTANWLLDDGITTNAELPAGVLNVATALDIQDVIRTREDAKKILDKLDELMPTRKDVIDLAKQDYSPVPKVAWIAWLNRSQAGLPVLETKQSLRNGRLIIETGADFRPIGNVKDGRASFESADTIAAGCPVFVVYQE